VFPTAFALFKLIEKTIGLRVFPEEELEGLDFAEHGGNAYPDFEVSTRGGMSTPGIPAGAMAAVSVGYMETAKKLEAS
jgi:Amt family ammonium transporter